MMHAEHLYVSMSVDICAGDFQECVVHSCDDYAVVHKPAGVQVAPTVDNVLESVLACTAEVGISTIVPDFPSFHLQACMLLHRCLLSSHGNESPCCTHQVRRSDMQV